MPEAPSAPFDLPRAQRWFAVAFNNQAWDLIEMDTLSEADAELLIDTAHASCRHWREAGDATNYLRGQALLATAYARVGYGEVAVRHAERCRKAAEAATPNAWDAACVDGCATRAYAAAGDAVKAAAFRERATAAANAFDDPEETALFARLFLR